MSTLVFDFDRDSSISLESQMQRLALEAGALANVIDTFRNLVPNLTSRISETLASLSSSDKVSDLVKELKTSHIHITKKLPKANFTDYSNTLVSVPEGFKGNLLEYLIVLNKLAPTVFLEANKILGEYNFALSAFITNKENKISLKDHTDLFHRVQRIREDLTKDIIKFFPSTSNQSKVYLKDIMHRFADVSEILEQAYTLDTQYHKVNIRDISDGVKKSVDMLNIIISNIQQDGVNKVSGNAAMNISTGAYELAKYVEFISVFRFRNEQALAAVNNTMHKLDEIL